MQSPFSSAFANALRFLTRSSFCVIRSGSFSGLQIVLCTLLCVLYTAGAFSSLGLRGLQMDMNRDNLVGEKEHYHNIFVQFHKEFPQQDEIVSGGRKREHGTQPPPVR